MVKSKFLNKEILKKDHHILLGIDDIHMYHCSEYQPGTCDSFRVMIVKHFTQKQALIH